MSFHTAPLSPIPVQDRVLATAALSPLADVASHSEGLVASQDHSSDEGSIASEGVEPAVGTEPAPLDSSSSPVTPPEAMDTTTSGGLVYGAMGGPSAWWTPILAPGNVQLTANTTTSKTSKKRKRNSASVELVSMSSRPRLRKVDDKGKLVWPFELEAVLIAGLRKYHATSGRPRPSASRNFNRNKLVSEYIESMTGVKRTTKQIASRIQVLRDAWKGKKEFTLVAQPCELVEMGYLPPLNDSTEPDLATALAQELQHTGSSPVRHVRRTRRSRNQLQGKVYDDDDLDLGFDSMQSPSQHTSTRPSRRTRVSPSQVEVPSFSPLVAFDPYQLGKLGSPQTSLEKLIPSSTLFFVKNTLRRDKGLPTLLAKCMLSSVRNDSIPPEVCMSVDMDPASIIKRIESFGESPKQREKLGTQVHLIQSSLVWDQETILGRNAGLAERIIGPSNNDRADRSSPSRPEVSRYVLDLQPAARQAIAAGRRHVIVVQTLSLLRVSDSRLLDSWMIIWVVQNSSGHTRMELVRLSPPSKDVVSRASVRIRSETPLESEDSCSSDSSLSPPSPSIAPAPISTLHQTSRPVDYPASLEPDMAQDLAPLELSPLGKSLSMEPYAAESEEEAQEFDQVRTPSSRPLTPVPIDEEEEDRNPHTPVLFDATYEELSEDMHMRDAFSPIYPEFSQEASPAAFSIAPQESPPPLPVQNYTVALEMLASSSTVPLYTVVQRPDPRDYHAQPTTHITSPRAESVVVPQIHDGASQASSLSNEWHYTGHEQSFQRDADPRYAAPSAYHPVLVQNIDGLTHPRSQFVYLEEMARDPSSPPTSASPTSTSSHAHYYISNGRPITAEHEWYSSAGTSAGEEISHRHHRCHAEDSNWTANSYIRHRPSFSSGPVVASVEPDIQLPQPPFQAVQYVYNSTSSFGQREAMAPDAYSSDDISGYHFQHTSPTFHSHHPEYSVPHSHMRHVIESSVYDAYHY